MFVLKFLQIYGILLFHIAPLVIFLLVLILLLGWRVGRIEGWSFGLGTYCAFITATTVGYGLIHPTTGRSRFLCVVIAFIGLVFTGILVALAYQSLQVVAQSTGLLDKMIKNLTSFIPASGAS